MFSIDEAKLVKQLSKIIVEPFKFHVINVADY